SLERLIVAPREEHDAGLHSRVDRETVLRAHRVPFRSRAASHCAAVSPPYGVLTVSRAAGSLSARTRASWALKARHCRASREPGTISGWTGVIRSSRSFAYRLSDVARRSQ